MWLDDDSCGSGSVVEVRHVVVVGYASRLPVADKMPKAGAWIIQVGCADASPTTVCLPQKISDFFYISKWRVL